MKRRPEHGVLVISIDLAGDSSALGGVGPSSTTTDTAAVLDTARWLLRLLDQLRLPATWFIAGPGGSLIRSQVLMSDLSHEVGLLITEHNPESTGRFQFAQTLQRRLLAARAAGVEVTSIAAHRAKRIDHLDLLVKHGIRAVRPGSGYSELGRSGWAAVSTLRFGIVSLPATMCGVDAPRWQRWFAGSNVRRRIVSAARCRQFCHLALDIHDLKDSASRESLQRSLRGAARFLDSADMHAGTVSSTAAYLLARPGASPAQSILRAA